MAKKNQFEAAHKARLTIGSPLAEVASAQIAFALVNPVTLAVAAYINASGNIVLANGQVLQSTLSLTDPTTPSISLASGSTNTGTITINGKTSGAFILTTADATAQNLTLKALAQTSGAGTLQIPDLAGATDTVVTLGKTQTLVGKTLTGSTLTGNINGDTAFCGTQLDKTTDTTLANLVGLDAIALVAGATYDFEINLAGTANASGGWKVAFNYTNSLTLTSLEATGQAFTAAAVAVQHTTTTTTQTALISSTAAVISGRITGRLVVNAAGTLVVQFAQNASNGSASSIYVGSKARFTRVG